MKNRTTIKHDAEQAAAARNATKARARANMRLAQSALGLLPSTPTRDGSTDDRTSPLPALVCIDVEAFEFAHDKLTEIGISIFNANAVRGIEPDAGAQAWREFITSHHYRIEEHRRLVNRKYVTGCPDDFNFGRSEWLSVADIAGCVKRVFKKYTVSGVKPILVCHNVESDTKYLSKAGVAVRRLCSETIDTEDLARLVNRETQNRGLSRVLIENDIEATNLHTGGNDARYTLEALLAMAANYTLNPKTKEQWRSEMKAEIQQAKRLAEKKVRDQRNGWDSDDGEDDDADESDNEGDGVRADTAPARPAFAAGKPIVLTELGPRSPPPPARPRSPPPPLPTPKGHASVTAL